MVNSEAEVGTSLRERTEIRDERQRTVDEWCLCRLARRLSEVPACGYPSTSDCC